MLATQSPSSMGMIGRGELSKFVKIALLALLEVDTVAAADSEVVMVDVEVMAVEEASLAAGDTGEASEEEVATAEGVTAALQLHSKPVLPPRHQILSPTSLVLVVSAARSSTSATYA